MAKRDFITYCIRSWRFVTKASCKMKHEIRGGKTADYTCFGEKFFSVLSIDRGFHLLEPYKGDLPQQWQLCEMRKKTNKRVHWAMVFLSLAITITECHTGCQVAVNGESLATSSRHWAVLAFIAQNTIRIRQASQLFLLAPAYLIRLTYTYIP